MVENILTALNIFYDRYSLETPPAQGKRAFKRMLLPFLSLFPRSLFSRDENKKRFVQSQSHLPEQKRHAQAS